MSYYQLLKILFACFLLTPAIAVPINDTQASSNKTAALEFHPSWSNNEKRELSELHKYITRHKLFDDLYVCGLFHFSSSNPSALDNKIMLDWRQPECDFVHSNIPLKWFCLLKDPLLLAKLQRHMREDKAMIEETIKTANPHAQTPDHATALHFAAARGKVHLIRKLIQLGADKRLHIISDPFFNDLRWVSWYIPFIKWGDTPISLAIWRYGDNLSCYKTDDTIIESIKALNLDRDALNYSGPQNFHPIFLNAMGYNMPPLSETNTVQTYLYENFIDPAQPLPHLSTLKSPVRPAIFTNNLELINDLLSKGADPNPTYDKDYLSTLKLNSDKSAGIIQCLHHYGVDLNATIDDILHPKLNKQRPLIHIWLEHSLFSNQVNKEPYDYILRSLKTCLQLNIDLHATDTQGRNILDIFIEQKGDIPNPESIPILQFLKDQGLSPTETED